MLTSEILSLPGAAWMGRYICGPKYKSTNTVGANLEAGADTVAGSGDQRFTRAQKRHKVEILEAIVASAETGALKLFG